MTDRGEDGIFQVVEAVLVAVLVAGCLIFFALVQKPTAGTSAEGQDLAQVAADTLDILRADGSLDTIATADADSAGSVAQLLPDDILFVLVERASDGTTTVVAASSGATLATAHNAQAASAYANDGGNLRLMELVVWNGF